MAFKGKSDVFEVLVAYALLLATDGAVDGASVDAALQALPKATLSAVEEYDQHLAQIAAAVKDEPIIYTLGSGPSYGWAYGLAMCYLQEMQWKHAAGFNTGEFFQGAFEMVTEDTAVLLFLGEDASRPMAERGKAFLETYTRKGHFIDVRDLTLPGVPAEARADVSPLVVGELAGQARAALRGGARPPPRPAPVHVPGAVLGGGRPCPTRRPTRRWWSSTATASSSTASGSASGWGRPSWPTSAGS